MKNKASLIEIINKYAIPPFNTELIDDIEYSVRLTPYTSNKIEIGKTKFGGNPHLPSFIDWVKKPDGKHFSFLVQVNLSEIASFDSDNLLPESGMIYFFLDLDSWNSGKVIFTPDVSDLEEAETPIDISVEKKSFLQRIFKLKGRSYYLNEFGVEISKEYHVPSWDSLRVKRIATKHKINKRNYQVFKEEVWEDELLYEKGENEMTSNHHLLGLYNGIQNEYYETEFVEFKNFKKMSVEEIDKALNWKLLLQIDSDKLMNWSWGDWGKIYFFIHKDDFKKCNFDNVQIVGECY